MLKISEQKICGIETKSLNLPKLSRQKFQDNERNIWRIHKPVKV